MTQTNLPKEDMSSGKGVPKHVSLSDMRENIRDNAMKFVDTIGIVSLFKDVDNIIALREKNIDKFLFNQEVLPHVRKTSPEEYAKWLSKRIKAGFMPTHFYDYEFEEEDFYTLGKNRKININGEYYGAGAFNILIPEGSSVKFKDIGQCNIFDMNDITKETRIVPIFKDIIELLDPEAKELALKWKKNQRETTLGLGDVKREYQDFEESFNEEILPYVRKTNSLEYANWLSESIQRGFMPTHIRNDGALRKFYTLQNGEKIKINEVYYGVFSFNLFIPEGSSVKFNNVGHCNIYDMNSLTSKEIKKVYERPIDPEIAKYLTDSAKKILKGVYDRKLIKLEERRAVVQNNINELTDELYGNKENIVTYGHLLSSEEREPIIVAIKKIEEEIRSLERENIYGRIKEIQMILEVL